MWNSRAIRPLRPLLGTARMLALGAAVGALCGAASALFLWLLDWATATREARPELVLLLPIAGLAMGGALAELGASVRGGNNLVIERLHDGGPQLPRRMAPLVLVGTVLTHLFGGSAGREGTAVQMGGSLADALAHTLRCDRHTRTQLLAAGIAGGFGSVFGTPLAGCVFGMEVVTVGRVEGSALLPTLTAALVGDGVTRALGITHTPYPRLAPLALDLVTAGRWGVMACAVAAVVWAFVFLTDALKRTLEARVPKQALRMALGGAAVLLGSVLLDTRDYLGLGVPTILRALSDPELPALAFAYKLGFTSLTLGSGFMGGEVTPLFFVGACLGNTLGQLLGLPLALGAAVAMAATFGVAANTPIALSIMAAELFGADVLPHVALVSVLAYVLTGARGIYRAQRVIHTKRGRPLVSPTTLERAAEAGEEPRP
jgi:H+/Cl- antiporter ClcA